MLVEIQSESDESGLLSTNSLEMGFLLGLAFFAGLAFLAAAVLFDAFEDPLALSAAVASFGLLWYSRISRS